MGFATLNGKALSLTSHECSPMKGVKRKRQKEAGVGTGACMRAAAADAAAARLEKMGEAFLSSFEALPARQTSRHPDKVTELCHQIYPQVPSQMHLRLT